jgi:hypothetical protein
VKIYAVAVEALRKKERQDETQFTTKIGGKTSCVKFSFPINRLMPYYAKTGRSQPPNRETLRITLLTHVFLKFHVHG